MVARTLIRPPASRLGPATDAERAQVMAQSPVRGVYDTAVDRESAHEILTARAEAQAAGDKAAEDRAQVRDVEEPSPGRTRARAPARPKAAPRARSSNRQTPMEALTKSVLRTAGTTLTRELLRGVLGGLRRR